MEAGIELAGVVAFGVVLLVIVVHGLVVWARSRRRPSKKDDDGGGLGTSAPDSGYWGEADSGVDSTPA